MTVDVPVRPHVKQYLKQNIFFKSKEFILTSTSVVGSFLLEMIEPKGKGMPPLRYNDDKFITIQLTYDYNYIVKPYLSHARARKFNLFVDRKIKEEMYVFIDTLRSYGVKNINESIEAFRIKYDFKEEDMAFEKLKRAYLRYRKRLESRENKAA